MSAAPRLAREFFLFSPLALLFAGWTQERPASPVPLAVVAHPKNDTRGLTLEELRAIFTLDRQFWPGGRRIVLLLRPRGSAEQKVLLEKVYRMSEEELRKYWEGKLFAGQIPAVPSTVRATPKVVAMVKEGEGALSVVLANEVPEGVRVIPIDGKSPGEPGYPLASRPSP